MFWTEEKEQKLEALVRSRRFTLSEIALQLGCTRNAAIGKAQRMGFDDRKPRQPRQPRKLKPKAVPAAAVPAAAVPAAAVPAAAVPAAAVPWMCQWKEGHDPKNRSDFCGKPTVIGKSWCPEHYKRVFTQSSGQKAPARLRLF